MLFLYFFGQRQDNFFFHTIVKVTDEEEVTLLNCHIRSLLLEQLSLDVMVMHNFLNLCHVITGAGLALGVN